MAPAESTTGMQRLNHHQKELERPDNRDMTPDSVVRVVELILWSINLHTRSADTSINVSRRRKLAPLLICLAHRAAPSARKRVGTQLGTSTYRKPHRSRRFRFPSTSSGPLRLLRVHAVSLKISTGDESPIGRDGTGLKTHAFNDEIVRARAYVEEKAIANYHKHSPSRHSLRAGRTPPRLPPCPALPKRCLSRASTKLQTLAFIIEKKAGDMNDKHIHFTLRYAEKGVAYFPQTRTVFPRTAE